ncbi:MAG TPA: hypothetical protein P5268_06290 [Candidatus Marinimicrobia bacterium]|nr:hypothetical protein [Candidatus Neomarinimicrobiota bacterium]HRS51827.1 hypothetical protein [Candidatus Neomarinimicrobiota bacterium]HRU92621.1 hypothetical protein [Candidatus Neomarinimicrobiota bacterium]
MNQPVSAVITKKRYNHAKQILKPLFIPFDHYVTYLGLENIVPKGPNLIVANHPGVVRDIAGIVAAYDRELYFLTAHYLFDEKVFMQEHIKPALGPYLFPILHPIAKRFTRYLIKALQEHEMIPINKEYTGNLVTFAQNLRNAINQVEDYLLKGRAVVIFQINYNILKTIGQEKVTNKEPSQYHSYIPRFNHTFGKIVWKLYHDDGLIVPVTPIGIYGAEGLNPFRKMVINIGKPLDITSCLPVKSGSCRTDGNEISPQNLFTKFTVCLEQRIAELLQESGLPATI